MMPSQPTRGNRPVGPRPRVRYLSAATLVVVTLVVVIAVVAAATQTLEWLPRALIALYFPPFLVNGTPNPGLVGLTVSLVLAAFLLYRQKHWNALAALALPIAATWVFAWALMGD